MEHTESLRYTHEHTWVRDENGKCYVGITSYAQEQLGEIIYVELPAVGDKIKRMGVFGVVESLKAVNDLFAPVSGGIAEVNDVLEEMPEIINSDPYGDGWMIAVEITDGNELEGLLTAEEYKDMVEEE